MPSPSPSPTPTTPPYQISDAMKLAIGDLISKLNPYGPDMNIYVGNPDPNGQDPANNAAQIDLEAEQYGADWEFKEVKHRVNAAIRIKYRYPVRDKTDPMKVLYWLDDYLLIGYEGGAGP
jgi:hypothetical protein